MGSPPLGLPAVVARRIQNRVTGAGARTDRRPLETMLSTLQEAAGTIEARGHNVPSGMQRSRHQEEGCAGTSSEDCAMTSRTNRQTKGQQQQEDTRTSPSALHQRRQEVLERYLAGEPIAMICQQLGCAKSWLYKWKKRYQVTEPAWFQEHSRRPETTPTKTPEALAAEIVRLHQTLAPDGSGTVSADGIRDHLRQRRVESIPSRRTIYRILNRQT